MALSANTARVYESGNYNDLPVKASQVIYEGSAVGMTSGYARALVAGDIFAGFAQAKVTGGSSDGDVLVNVIRSGLIALAVTSVAVTDIGKAVYASDDGTFTLTQGSNTRIGTVERFVSSGNAIVKFEPFNAGGSLTGITTLTDNSGGGAADGTISAVTAPTALTDNGGGTADGTVVSLAAATTLTDSTGLSGSHNDTLEAVTTFTPSVAWNGSSVYPSAADATAIATAITALNQNASDTAQKVIEIVTWQGSVQNNFKELTTAQGENRTAIIALTDAVKELSTKINAIINAQD